jgi:hypothetical protein
MNAESTSKWKELANRVSDGLDVSLVWAKGDGKDEVVVRVTDFRAGDYFEIRAEPARALDVYHHPFAYRGTAQSTTAAAVPRSPMIRIGDYGMFRRARRRARGGRAGSTCCWRASRWWCSGRARSQQSGSRRPTAGDRAFDRQARRRVAGSARDRSPWSMSACRTAVTCRTSWPRRSSP